IGYPIFGPKVENITGLEHLPRKGGFIIAANHVDWLDGFYIAVALGRRRNIPVYFLTKSNYYRWTTLALQIPRQKSAIVDQAVQYLKSGKVICNFPEGQRNTGKRLLPGRTGTVRMAIAADVPIVPLGITCSPGKNMAQSLVYLMSNRHPVRLAIGRPLAVTAPDGEITADYLTAMTEQLMRAIAPLAGKTL
ncbi:MAG: 1-acyl-sn-glycerol-3-phosphate acyltransferase, partial [Candidatus Kerfeldbacteria bacterium]|nr:1-acyl-sn-glycerol-3-phosphate acyltransferase [Candidatus Kerfeldbacteria bacterium]